MKIINAGIIIACFFISVQAQSNHAGVIVSIKGADVIVKNENSEKPFQTGETLHLLTGDLNLVLEVTFPMQTSSKCKVVSGDVSKLKPGMVVFSGTMQAPIERKTETVKSNLPINFKDNGNGTLTDLHTGLIWLKNANVPGRYFYWKDAGDYCRGLKIAGYNDWRLPSKDEMMTLVDWLPKNQECTPVLLSQGFIDIQDTYWTSSELSQNVSYCFSFGKGSLLPFTKTGTPNIYVIPVRGTVFAKRNNKTEQTFKQDVTDYLKNLSPSESKQYKTELKSLIDSM